MDIKYRDVQSLLKEDPQRLDEILQKVKENTKTECINIRTKISNEPLSATCSKFGGVPYWPNNRIDYPKTDKGIPLTMLAQFNFSALPQNNVFPDKGLLQFYIWNADDMSNYKVVFHEDCDIPLHPATSSLPTSLMKESVTITWVGKAHSIVTNPFWGEPGFPLVGEMALEFSKGCDFVNVTESCFDEEFIKAARQLDIPISDDFYVYPLPDECGNEWYEIGCGHKLLGRPCFVQNDYRESNDKDDILLFQIDSASDSGEEDNDHLIILGDSGTAGFFIKPNDLKNLDFSNVFYDWSCC